MIRWFIPGLLGLACIPAAAAQTCGNEAPVQLQVLGSGGPELHHRRAASGYLVWIEGKARVLVDLGGGAAPRFAEAGARVSDLDVILFTRLHTDRTADLPVLIGASLYEDRTRPLPILGPDGNRLMPSTVTFVRTLFDGTRGAWRHLGDFLNPLSRGGYKLQPRDVRPAPGKPRTGRRPDEDGAAFANARLRAVAVSVNRENVPALAWRVTAGGTSVVFGGDGDGQLEPLARGADLLIAHHAVPESADAPERGRHMPPSAIGRLAQQAQARQLVLSHRARSTLGREEETLGAIRRHYAGPVRFADDLDCFTP